MDEFNSCVYEENKKTILEEVVNRLCFFYTFEEMGRLLSVPILQLPPDEQKDISMPSYPILRKALCGRYSLSTSSTAITVSWSVDDDILELSTELMGLSVPHTIAVPPRTNSRQLTFSLSSYEFSALLKKLL